MEKEKAQDDIMEPTPTPEATPEFAESDPIQEKMTTLEAKVAELQTQLRDTHDKMLRIAADSDNTRKRLEKEKVDTRLYAIQAFAKDLLPVIDAFDKAMSALTTAEINGETEEGKKMSPIIEGVQMVAKVFEESLKKHGIEKLPGKGSPFNPMYHNGIAKVTDPALDKETVIDEFLSGYKIGDRILRTAMVRVGAPD